MKINIEISNQEYDILVKALNDYKDFMLDQSEAYKESNNIEESNTWLRHAKETKNLLDKVRENVSDLAYQDHLVVLEEDEKKATDAMIEWARSEKTEPTSELKDIIEIYFNDSHVNEGTKEYVIISHRQMAYEKLVIGCIHACNKEELDKLDHIKNVITDLTH